VNLVRRRATDRPDVSWNKAEGTGDRQRFRLAYAWDLAKLDGASLKPGDVLEYHLLVKDNYALDGQLHTGSSERQAAHHDH
jgi:hypothetical protein